MKNNLTLILASTFLFIQFSASAQDSSRHSAATTINKTSAHADKLGAKRIEQQSLSNNHVEKLGGVATTTNQVKKKTVTKVKRKKS